MITSCLESLVNNCEESVKVFLREVFQIFARIINGFADWFVSLIIHRSAFRRRQNPSAWQNWTSKSTFNALAERDGLIQSHSSSMSPTPSPRFMRRRGSELFSRPAGDAIGHTGNRGLFEDTRLAAELAVTIAFEHVRSILQVASVSNQVLTEENRNEWTAGDVIVACGYPLEEYRVITMDGYVLEMQRIPRRGASEVVFFQHGILDTSLGWVANGASGSQAFGAYDQGFDVWLGSSRANPPKRHLDPEIENSSVYWKYSLNELGREDIAAQIDHIHKVKTAEHEYSQRSWPRSSIDDENLVMSPDKMSGNINLKMQQPPCPYRLQAVGHSLGAASLLMYAVTNSMAGKPSYITRMVLLTPAGFHCQYPRGAAPFTVLLPLVMKALQMTFPGLGVPAYIPSSLLRQVIFKLAADFVQFPALRELTRASMHFLLNEDASEWDRALTMPHYSKTSMPVISLHSGDHLIQLINTQQFRLYDYGSPQANEAKYNASEPTNLANNYHYLRGISIDLVAGSKDGVVSRDDVLMHYDTLEKAGVEVSFKEFDVGHLDMTFAHKDQVRQYVLRRLMHQ